MMLGGIVLALLLGTVYVVTAIRKLPPPIMVYSQLDRTIALEREGSAVRNPFSFLGNALISSK
ncbi:hypothetical protein A2680_03715 [Candidatus Kaiserbacteria bacterium RIFCSPHIGHO2_01_FULL_55_37]|nr:MAG: hypothetical protein A2680_03715 [Candidatus Kaiserbacteria bacterium RIFCSPHIGHO2_01_FULL_55_37]